MCLFNLNVYIVYTCATAVTYYYTNRKTMNHGIVVRPSKIRYKTCK